MEEVIEKLKFESTAAVSSNLTIGMLDAEYSLNTQASLGGEKRSGAKKAVVFVTTGLMYGLLQYITDLVEIMKSSDIAIYAVGVGDHVIDYLMQLIATSPRHRFTLTKSTIAETVNKNCHLDV